ncbi:MAG: branched-chain amino acid ABC transporter substrate-binding protein [Alphaproteobacteria bacterium]|nr:branched-chain amino acid ABC transporter substrate-binding protein [Alphaproteobacteria bacterium]
MGMKRSILLSLAAGVLLSGGAMAQPKEVKIGLIAPLSGPWARQGELMRKGAELAVDDINGSGGIQGLGGAKIRLIVGDAGENAEKAKNAAQRLLSEHPDLSAGTGAWLSSFTLAITEVTERAKLPWLTLSYSEQITARGFKYVFQTSATAADQAQKTLPIIIKAAQAAGAAKPKTMGVISDNTASPVNFMKFMREKGLQENGVELVVDEVFTPPLADATPPVQKVRQRRPDMMLVYPTGTADVKLVLEKFKEFNLDKGRLPMFGNGAQFGTPEILNAVGKDLLEGFIFSLANWPTKETEAMAKRFMVRFNEPFVGQDPVSTYGDVQLVKAVIEKMKSAEAEKVAEGLRAIDLKGGVAAFYAGGKVKFEDNGRRADAGIYLVQWQNGVPVTVYPPEAAQAKINWPKK